MFIIGWSWNKFMFPYVIFSLGTVMQQEFSNNAWIAVLVVAFLLGFTFRKE